jgi:hypothetical protein
MSAASPSLISVLDRAVQEPDLLAELAADPLDTVRRLGVRLTGDDLKVMLGVDGASDAELLEVIRRRLAQRRAGCGGCSIP